AALAEVEAVFATAGAISRSGEPDEVLESVGQLLVRLRPGAGAAGEEAVAAAVRALAAGEPGLAAPTIARPGIVAVRSPLEVLVDGRDLAAIAAAAEQVAAALEAIPGLTDVRSSARGGRPEVRVDLDRRKLTLYG